MADPGTKKGWGKTVLGWFVVQDGEKAPAHDESADALIAKYASEAPAAPPPPEVKLVGELPKVAPGQALDFPAVYNAAGVDAEEQGRVDKAMNLLSTLPAATPKDVKKQIVEASLKAFGVPIDKIIEAGVEQIQALESYQRAGANDTKLVSEDAERKIAAFEAEIRQIRQIVEERVREQVGVVTSCNQRKLEVQRVLEFFGQEAVARVVRDSPRLIDPSAPIPPMKEK